MVKKHVLAEAGSPSSKAAVLLAASCRARIAWLIPKGEPVVGAQSIHSVREHGKMATCLRVAAFSLRSHFGEGKERRWQLFSTFPIILCPVFHEAVRDE